MSFYNFSDEEVEKFIEYAKETIGKFQVKIADLEKELSKTNLDLEFENQLLTRLRAEKTRREPS